MSTHAAFLRGMNVGGHRLTNPELHSLFEGMGFKDVAVYQASGNVVFDPGKLTGDAKLEAVIEEGLEKGLGYAVPVFVRSADEVRAVAGHEPFDPKAVKSSAGKLQVMFFKKAPKDGLEALATDEDQLAVKGKELYWLPSGGVLDSELDFKGIDALAGVLTQRTMGTVERLAKKFF